MTPFLGQLLLVPFNFAPRGWALCDGRMMAVNQNQALFSILGTTFGGNGVTTFGLPDLRGRAAHSSGQGVGLSSYTLGEVTGVEGVALSIVQIPAHQHPFYATKSAANTDQPAGAMLADTGTALNVYTASPTQANGPMSATAVGSVGSNQSHSNQSPYLVLNWIIALQGIYPTRS
jgi:microcystin-dependent protein